jgi:putative CocE/NonD family hydrolase
VNVFVMGADRWRGLEDWPPLEMREEAVHLTAAGGLEGRPPQAGDEPRRYSYDPEDPCPTCGGAIMLPLTYPRGPVDQRRVAARPDVLLYRSEPLAETLELIGPVRARIWARTSAAETDLVLKLCRVTASGAILNLCDGVLRTTGPAPGEIHGHDVGLAATAVSLAPGERIALTITSSDFPRYSRAQEAALQEIFGDAEHPSHLILPVVAGKLTV